MNIDPGPDAAPWRYYCGEYVASALSTTLPIIVTAGHDMVMSDKIIIYYFSFSLCNRPLAINSTLLLPAQGRLQ